MKSPDATLMCAVCPRCSTTVLAPDDGVRFQDSTNLLAFLACGLCGLEFAAPVADLLFQAAPLEWFSQGNA